MLWLGTWNVRILLIIALIQERYARTGAVRTVFVPEEYATVCLDILDKTVQRQFARLISTSTLQTAHADRHALQAPTKTFSQKRVSHVTANARNA